MAKGRQAGMTAKQRALAVALITAAGIGAMSLRENNHPWGEVGGAAAAVGVNMLMRKREIAGKLGGASGIARGGATIAAGAVGATVPVLGVVGGVLAASPKAREWTKNMARKGWNTGREAIERGRERGPSERDARDRETRLPPRPPTRPGRGRR